MDFSTSVEEPRAGKPLILPHRLRPWDPTARLGPSLPSQGAAQVPRKYLEPSGSEGLCQGTRHWYSQTAPIPLNLSSLPCPVHVLPSPHCPQEDLSWSKPQAVGEKPVPTRQKTVHPSHWPRISSPLGCIGLPSVLTPHIVEAACFVTCVEMDQGQRGRHKRGTNM